MSLTTSDDDHDVTDHGDDDLHDVDNRQDTWKLTLHYNNSVSWVDFRGPKRGRSGTDGREIEMEDAAF